MNSKVTRGLSFSIRALRKAIFWAYVVLMLVLTLSPSTPAVFDSQWDKLYHAIGFAGFSVIFYLAFQKTSWWLMILTGLTLGLFIEIIQIYVPRRSFDWWDWVADALGILVGIIVCSALKTGNEFEQ